MNQKNRQVIDEFRANGGVVKVTPPRGPILLLHSKGARSTKACLTPLMYMRDDERLVIFASKGGTHGNPDWYFNLVANPEAFVEVGSDAFAVSATVAKGAERDALFARQAADYPQFDYYQGKTQRKIPVIVLERAGN